MRVPETETVAPVPEPEPEPVQVTPHEEGERVYFDWQQPGWNGILDGLGVLRDNRLVNPLSFGVSELEIPVGILHFLKRKYPDLDSKDSGIKTRAWKRFIASPESKPFRTRNRGRFLARSVGGLDNGWKSGRPDGIQVGNVSDGKENGPATDAGLCGGTQGRVGLGD